MELYLIGKQNVLHAGFSTMLSTSNHDAMHAAIVKKHSNFSNFVRHALLRRAVLGGWNSNHCHDHSSSSTSSSNSSCSSSRSSWAYIEGSKGQQLSMISITLSPIGITYLFKLLLSFLPITRITSLRQLLDTEGYNGQQLSQTC